MNRIRSAARRHVLALALPALLLIGASGSARAHCDTLDGPVVAAARQALDENNANRVLIWVKKESESETKAAFDKAVGVRKLNPTAKEMADMYFSRRWCACTAQAKVPRLPASSPRAPISAPPSLRPTRP